MRVSVAMMSFATVLTLGFLALASASPVIQYPTADKVYLEHQRDILQLFAHIKQNSWIPQIQKIASEFKFEEHKDFYTKKQAYEDFMYYYHSGFFPKNEIFSIFHEEQKEEAIALFHLFYYAKDFDTFYKTACWARIHMNDGIFVYALTVAVLHRPDTRGFYIPPPYEIYPHYFLSSEVLRKAELMNDLGKDYHYNFKYNGVEKIDENKYAIYANYSGWFIKHNYEQKLSYFTEDIGLNSYYYYFHADYPFWMGGEEFGLYKDRRGELYYYFHQQLLARFYLERLSNDFGEIPTFSWNKPIETGFYPSLTYYNGLPFPQRPNHFHLQDHEHYTYELEEVSVYEKRFREVVYSGYYLTPDGEKVLLDSKDAINILGNIVESNGDSPNYKFYKYFFYIARYLLGPTYHTTDDYFLAPSALQHFETTLRDPIFWQLYKRVLKYFFDFMLYKGPYTSEELHFPGVNVKNVEVDKLVTYFDYFDVPLYNHFLYSSKDYEHPEMKFYARQLRLNHSPFNVKIEIDSDKTTDSVVRIFIGPKFDSFSREIELEHNRINFFELDTFVFNLKAGKNVIERHSDDFFRVTEDFTKSYDFYQEVEKALQGSGQFILNDTEIHYGFPDRLLLPKGKKGGMPFYFYVIVSPYHAPEKPYGTDYEEEYYSGVGTGARYIDNKPFGYPFDRKIGESWFFPNMYFKDVIIFHKSKYHLNKNYFYHPYENVDEKF